jgi:hypothetical protein
MIVANDVSREDAGFEVDTNAVKVIYRDGRVEEWALMLRKRWQTGFWIESRRCGRKQLESRCRVEGNRGPRQEVSGRPCRDGS